MSASVSIQLPEPLALELEGVARATKLAKSFHLQKALELYLEEYADLQVALDRLEDSSDPVVSLEEMRQKLGL